MLWIKNLHIVLALVSISGFVVRIVLNMLNSHWMASKALRVSPHIVDTLLLLSGVLLAFQWPLEGLGGWLPYKLLALVCYILFGLMAFRMKTKIMQVGASIGALVSVFYLLGIALYKSPLSWFV